MNEVHRYDGLKAIEKANEYTKARWKIFQYEPHGRCLALSASANDSARFTAFLVFRSPVFVRSNLWLRGNEFLIYTDVPRQVPKTLPSGINYSNSSVAVVDRSSDFCVVCESLSLYDLDDAKLYNRLPQSERGSKKVLSAIEPEIACPPGGLIHCSLRVRNTDMGSRSAFDLHRRIQTLNGCTLEWWGLTDQLQQCLFRATGLEQGFGQVYFGHTQKLNVPNVMNHIRLRFPSAGDNVGLAARHPQDERRWREMVAERPEAEIGLVIECDEGTFSLEAFDMSICCTEDPNIGEQVNYYGLSNLNSIHDPLWADGPFLREM